MGFHQFSDKEVLEKIEYYYTRFHLEEKFSKNMKSEMRLHCFPKGSAICKLDEPLPALMFFVEGKAKVLGTLANGKQLLIAYYEPVQMIGDLEVIRGKNATTSMVAVSDCCCLGIPFDRVQSLLLNDPVFLLCICDELGQKLDRITKNSAINMLSPLENRLSSYILAVGTHPANDIRTQADGLVFSENLTYTAELLGTSFRHLHRTLGHLCDLSILKKDKTGYRVVDGSALMTLSAGKYSSLPDARSAGIIK